MHLSEQFSHMIERGETEQLKSILDEYDLPVEADADGSTLLHYASEHGNIEMAKYLLFRGYDLNSRNAKRKTPLMKSLEGRHQAVAQLLIEAGAEIADAIHVAVRWSDAKSVRLLLERGANVEDLNRKRVTPLFYLHVGARDSREREGERIEILRLFLDLGVWLTRPVRDGYFSVGLTLSRGSCEAVRLVLRSNIDFSSREGFCNKTILHFLAMNEDPGMVEEVRPFIERFDVNAVDKWGGSPLHEAMIRGNVGMAEFLLGRGAIPSVFHRDYRFTTLSSTCAYSWPVTRDEYDRCLELLLRHDVDAQEFVTDEFGKPVTIVDVAMKYNNFQRLKCVIAQMAVRERQNFPITELISSKLDEHRELKDYLKRCRRLLKKKIAGDLSVFQLLRANEKTVSKYLNSKKLIVKLLRISCKSKLKSSYPYYYNILRELFDKGFLYKTLKDKAATVITRLLGYRFDKSSIAIENIIGHLNDQDLRQLHVM